MRILWFLVLKIVEVSGVVFMPHYLGKLIHSWTGFMCNHGAEKPICAPMWIIGFSSVLVVVAVVLTCVLIVLLIGKNWVWAEDLRLKFKKY